MLWASCVCVYDQEMNHVSSQHFCIPHWPHSGGAFEGQGGARAAQQRTGSAGCTSWRSVQCCSKRPRTAAARPSSRCASACSAAALEGPGPACKQRSRVHKSEKRGRATLRTRASSLQQAHVTARGSTQQAPPVHRKAGRANARSTVFKSSNQCPLHW